MSSHLVILVTSAYHLIHNLQAIKFRESCTGLLNPGAGLRDNMELSATVNFTLQHLLKPPYKHLWV